MPFTPEDFHDLLDPDIWVLEQVFVLPSDPPGEVTQSAGVISVVIHDTVGMGLAQDSVAEYRSRLLPIILVLAQKVYAELFRVVLGNCGRDAGEKQKHIEETLIPLLADGTIASYHPFADASDLRDWWDRRYNFAVLRKARNQLAHNSYEFDGDHLVITEGAGNVLLDWRRDEVLAFAEAVLGVARRT